MSVVVGLLAASCGPRADPALFDEVGGTAGLREVAAQFNTGLDLENQAFLLNAVDTVTERCMRQAGYRDFDYPGVVSPGDLYAFGAGFTDLDLWLLDDLEQVRRVGYGFAEGVKEQQAASFNPDRAGDPYDTTGMTSEELAAFDLALSGTGDEYVTYVELDGSTNRVSTGGCIGDAYERIYGDVATWFRLWSLRSDLQGELWERVRSDRGLRAVLGDWSTCMDRRGFDVDTPDDAAELAGSALGDMSLADARTFEIDVASADVECRHEVGMLRVFGGAYVTVARELLAQWEDDLVAFRRLEQEAIERAKQALAEPGA